MLHPSNEKCNVAHQWQVLQLRHLLRSEFTRCYMLLVSQEFPSHMKRCLRQRTRSKSRLRNARRKRRRLHSLHLAGLLLFERKGYQWNFRFCKFCLCQVHTVQEEVPLAGRHRFRCIWHAMRGQLAPWKTTGQSRQLQPVPVSCLF